MVKLHLRRVMPSNSQHPPEPIPEKEKYRTLILLSGNTRVGRQLDQNDVLLQPGTPKDPHDMKGVNNMISRCHADILHSTQDGRDEYYIFDRSLNGTYLNDVRVPKFANELDPRVKLKEGDMVKFGHLNGAAVRAGQHAPQAFSEFSFIVERANPTLPYLGFTPDARRVAPLTCYSETAIINVLSENEKDHVFDATRPPQVRTPEQQQQHQQQQQQHQQLPQHHSIRMPKPIVVPKPQQIVPPAAFQQQHPIMYNSPDFNMIYNGLMNNVYSTTPLLNSALMTGVYGNSQALMNSFSKLQQNHAVASILSQLQTPSFSAFNSPILSSRPTSQPIPTRESTPADLPSYPGLLIPVNVAAAVSAAQRTVSSMQPSPLVASSNVIASSAETSTTNAATSISAPATTGKSPPMECDSSVPSPPKNGVAPSEVVTTPVEVAAAPSKKPPQVEAKETTSISPPHATPSPSSENREEDDEEEEGDEEEEEIIDVEETPEEMVERSTPKATPTPPSITAEVQPKKRPRTNELNNLLSDFSTFGKKEKRSTAVHRRPTDEDIVEKMAQKELKRREKAALKAKNGTTPLKKRMKQLSDESSASSDSEDEIERKEQQQKRKTVQKKKVVQKRKVERNSEGEEDGSDEEEEEVEERASRRKTAAAGGKKAKKVAKKEIDKDSCGLGDECKGKKIDESSIHWVQCDECMQWWHVLCQFNVNVEYNDAYSYTCCGNTAKQTLPPAKGAPPPVTRVANETRRGRKPKY